MQIIPTVTYNKTLLGKATGHYSEAKILAHTIGVIEDCYDKNRVKGIMKIAADNYFDENLIFVCTINHFLLRKAGMSSNLMEMGGLTDGSIDAQMQQVFDTYVSTNESRQVNLQYRTRQAIIVQWTTIKSRQAMGQLLAARLQIAQLAGSNLHTYLNEKYVSKAVVDNIQKKVSPTDEKVMKVLDSQATSEIVHLGGKKLSHEVTMKQYAGLLNAK